MIEINWNNFRAKFNDREQKNFELLSYLLFLREFNHEKTGIFRYFNQTGIETEPIQVNEEWIGFQAKFYDTKISANKDKITDSIKDAKEKNLNLNKIYFYLNQEFSESSKKGKKKPQYQIDIEDFAKSTNVKIEWRVPSHFEAQLFLDENKSIAQYFFSLEKGVVDSIIELNNHTSSILLLIHSEIEFNDIAIKIDRSNTLKSLKTNLETSQIIILSGEGGVGKTALIKDFYNSIEKSTPFFIFKAIEFNNIAHINNFFQNYGAFTSTDFIKEFEVIQEKYIVIDSAEKLSDLEHPETFQEFLSLLLNNNWKVIFTTRYSYLDVLKYQFVEVYRLPFQLFDVEKLTFVELEKISNTHKFILPNDERFLDLLTNPFYLNEYLQNYESIGENLNHSQFKSLLWNKQILNSITRKDNIHLKREECFLSIAKKRADTGSFFVNADECNESALQALAEDEVIKLDAGTARYFVTHDIYEEWALDKIIERTFLNRESDANFFDLLGSSLPIRRAFRNWLSEKLIYNQDEIRPLIENSFLNDDLEKFWKDEILVSVLLSDYSETFFQMFENTILVNNQESLIKIIFLLRTACKEIDETLLSIWGFSKKDKFSIESVFTKPKGNGWNCTVDFIHKHTEKINLSKIDIVLPLLAEWNTKIKEGITTKQASQIALRFYEEVYQDSFSYRFKDNKEQLIQVILDGSSEIKEELVNIFEGVISKKEKSHRDKYYDLIEVVLSSAPQSYEIAKNLPKQVIKLAELFWFHNRDEDKDEDQFRYSKIMEVEDYFCISALSTKYFPASAFQTPVFQLLRFSPRETIDFILSFTNKTVECYANSNFNEVRENEIEIFISEKESVKQYISQRIWNTYRGTQDSPYLLNSIHMALEKYLLDYVKIASPENLESWCKYLIKNSKSASITAIVASLVLAHPEKLLNIAKMLFRTKEIFFYDTARMVNDQDAKSLYSIGKRGSNYEEELFQDERIKTCEDEHRRRSLEDIARNFQFFQFDEKQDFDEQQKSIWEILDYHYENLPPESEQTEEDKTWRIYLARIDRRKMSPTVEKEKDGERFIVSFNPELAPELKKISDTTTQKVSESQRYIPLQLWADSRFKRENENHKTYPQYEDNPQLALTETKEIIEGLSKGYEDFSLFNRPIPFYVCAVLMRDFLETLTLEEKEFCRQIIIEFASTPLRTENYYQSLDGTHSAIRSLSLLIEYFPETKDEIKSLLLLLLLSPWFKIHDSVINSILNDLWKINFEDAQSIFIGYLYLKPNFDKVRKELENEKRENNPQEIFVGDWDTLFPNQISNQEHLLSFIEKCGQDIEDIFENKIKFENIENLENLSFRTLNTAFELLPLKTTNEIHHKFVTKISEFFADNKKMSEEDKNNSFTLKYRIYKKFAYFVLSSTEEKAKTHVQPFIDNFETTDNISDFFGAFVSAEDYLNQYENFWTIWNLFYDKVVEICRESSGYHSTKEIVHNYLLAWQWWKKDAKSWRSLKEREKLFFQKIAKDIGQYPPVLFSLSKFLNEIGNVFLDDGIIWVSDILQNNKDLVSEELENGTIYYLENLIRKYILMNRSKIRKTIQVKKRLITILDFLVEKGSVTGYLLRESIL